MDGCRFFKSFNFTDISLNLPSSTRSPAYANKEEEEEDEEEEEEEEAATPSASAAASTN